MKMRKVIPLFLVCLMMLIVVCGCSGQAEKPAETEQTATAVETVETTAATEAVETTAAAEETTVPVEETAAPTEETWEAEPTEDPRPPIEVTIPKEPQPYTDYERYMDMSGEEQKAFYDSFDSEQAFFDWFHAARDEYEKAHPPVIIDGSTNIELVP